MQTLIKQLTYYLSYRCKPVNGHSNAILYAGMLADIFIAAVSEEEVETRAEAYLRDKGWMVEEMEFAELVEAPPAHDARFNALFHAAQKDGLAALLSPY